MLGEKAWLAKDIPIHLKNVELGGGQGSVQVNSFNLVCMELAQL